MSLEELLQYHIYSKHTSLKSLYIRICHKRSAIGLHLVLRLLSLPDFLLNGRSSYMMAPPLRLLSSWT
jgi:hypothetical protein